MSTLCVCVCGCVCVCVCVCVHVCVCVCGVCVWSVCCVYGVCGVCVWCVCVCVCVVYMVCGECVGYARGVWCVCVCSVYGVCVVYEERDDRGGQKHTLSCITQQKQDLPIIYKTTALDMHHSDVLSTEQGFYHIFPLPLPLSLPLF